MPVPTTFAVANLYKKRLLAGVELDRRPMLLRTLASLVFRSNGKTVEESINDLENNKANKSDLGSAAALNVAASGDAGSSEVVKGNDSRLSDARKASDVSAWAKSSVKPSYNYSEINNRPSLGTAATLDVAASGNANIDQVVKGDDTRLSDARNAADVYTWAKAATKPSYNYSEINNTPTLGTAAALNVAASGNAGSNQVVKGNDSRLSDARTPVAHTHTKSQITNFPTSMPASDVYTWAKASTSTFGSIKVGVDYNNVIEYTDPDPNYSLKIKSDSGSIFLDTKDIGIPSGTTFNTYWKIGSEYSNVLECTTGNTLQIKHGTNIYFNAPRVDTATNGTINGSMKVGSQYSNVLECTSTSNFQIKGSGKISLRASSGAEVCTYDASAYAPVAASAFNVSSSEKVKENITDMSEEEANKLFALRPVNYDYKNKGNGTNCYGLIAEEVEKVGIKYPLSTVEDLEYGEILALDYSKFVPYLIKVCQMQQKEIDELKNKIN